MMYIPWGSNHILRRRLDPPNPPRDIVDILVGIATIQHKRVIQLVTKGMFLYKQEVNSTLFVSPQQKKAGLVEFVHVFQGFPTR